MKPEYEFTLRFSGISENDFKKLVYYLESAIDDYFLDKGFKELINRKDDSNETTWYITISTNNFIVSTYNNILIPALCRVHTIPDSTNKTDYIIRKEKNYVRTFYY